MEKLQGWDGNPQAFSKAFAGSCSTESGSMMVLTKSRGTKLCHTDLRRLRLAIMYRRTTSFIEYHIPGCKDFVKELRCSLNHNQTR
jgi:hypothetical protein